MNEFVSPKDPQKAKEYFEQKMYFTTGPKELSTWIEAGENINIIDVRAVEDYNEGHIPGAISLPQARWDDTSVLSNDRTNVLYCYSEVCHLAAKAALKFARQGFPVMEMDGGMKAWKDYNLQIEKGAAVPESSHEPRQGLFMDRANEGLEFH